VTTLVEAGVSRADMFVAVTGEDQHNLVACQLAKTKVQSAAHYRAYKKSQE